MGILSLFDIRAFQEFWIFPSSATESDPAISVLHTLKDALLNAEPVQAELDRGLCILLPSQASKRVELPPDFFNVSAEEIKREQQARYEIDSSLRKLE